LYRGTTMLSAILRAKGGPGLAKKAVTFCCSLQAHMQTPEAQNTSTFKSLQLQCCLHVALRCCYQADNSMQPCAPATCSCAQKPHDQQHAIAHARCRCVLDHRRPNHRSLCTAC
jgi:hypothetical protein